MWQGPRWLRWEPLRDRGLRGQSGSQHPQWTCREGQGAEAGAGTEPRGTGLLAACLTPARPVSLSAVSFGPVTVHPENAGPPRLGGRAVTDRSTHGSLGFLFLVTGVAAVMGHHAGPGDLGGFAGGSGKDVLL